MSVPVVVDVRQLPHGEGLALPAYQSADAAGLDLLAAVPEDKPVALAAGIPEVEPALRGVEVRAQLPLEALELVAAQAHLVVEPAGPVADVRPQLA